MVEWVLSLCRFISPISLFVYLYNSRKWKSGKKKNGPLLCCRVNANWITKMGKAWERGYHIFFLTCETLWSSLWGMAFCGCVLESPFHQNPQHSEPHCATSPGLPGFLPSCTNTMQGCRMSTEKKGRYWWMSNVCNTVPSLFVKSKIVFFLLANCLAIHLLWHKDIQSW